MYGILNLGLWFSNLFSKHKKILLFKGNLIQNPFLQPPGQPPRQPQETPGIQPVTCGVVALVLRRRASDQKFLITWWPGCATSGPTQTCPIQGCISTPPLWNLCAWLLCPWDSPGQSTGVGCRALHLGIFPTQGSNWHLSRLLHQQVGSLPGGGFFTNSATWKTLKLKR